VPDILHDFPIFAPAQTVFDGVSTGPGLAQWWTERSSGTPKRGTEYSLWFGPKFDWVGRVTECVPLQKFELEITKADAHYRVSCYCWAMYLRILKRYLEHGETVPYAKRLDV
jgi:uncharacterized protein YndB with AHSA1/START domain